MRLFTSLLLKTGIPFGLAMGLCAFAVTAWVNIYLSLVLAVVVAVGCGAMFGIAMAVFGTSRTVKEQTQILLADGEQVIHSGGVNHFVGLEGVGGRLYLTNLRLYFKSHSFNIQKHELSIPLKEIAEAGYEYAKEKVAEWLANGRTQW